MKNGNSLPLLAWINKANDLTSYIAPKDIPSDPYATLFSEPRIGQKSCADVAYPHVAGAKSGDTSFEAAHAIESCGRAEYLRQKVYAELQAHSLGLSADQIAERLGESVLSIRPRCAELHKQERIKDSGRRAVNVSGKSAKVWCLV